MRFPDARILIFAKAPEPGRVKTRLIPALGAVEAAALAMRLLEQTVASVTAAALCPVQLWCAPDPEHAVFRQLADDHGLSLHRQSGADLGERMRGAAEQALASSEAVLLIGTDSPRLERGHLVRALQWLAEGQDAVLGPAEDGGYVLLGLRRSAAGLFAEMPWGSSRVLTLTRQRMTRLGWRWRELEPLWDLDRPADLQRWRAEAPSNEQGP